MQKNNKTLIAKAAHIFCFLKNTSMTHSKSSVWKREYTQPVLADEKEPLSKKLMK